jgi:hypothetical protein
MLEGLWRDPGQVPNGTVHSALYNARVLVHSGMVKDEGVGLDEQERTKYWDQYAKDLEVIVTTLPSRSEANRKATIDFLKTPQNDHLLRKLHGSGNQTDSNAVPIRID